LISTGLVFVGKFVFEAEAAVTNSVLFLTALATSWASISMFMYWRTKGQFDQGDLQVFNSGRTGGKYWYVAGWNLKALVAWGLGSVTGILAISSVDYLGPIAEVFAGLDLSVPTAAIVAIAIVAVLDLGKAKK
jgi:cytosine/uracil/thiamine/allantoin permease